jgi:hypothetical protein
MGRTVKVAASSKGLTYPDVYARSSTPPCAAGPPPQAFTLIELLYDNQAQL